MRKTFLFSSLLILATISCQKASDTVFVPDPTDATDIVDEVNVSVPPFELDNGAKSSLILSEGKLEFKWKKDDKLGFFPEAARVTFGPVQQAVFHIDKDQTSESSSKFVANGWGLLRNAKYYSYFPYSSSATNTSVGVNFESQTQTANDNCDHLASHDFLHTVKTITSSRATLEYNHLCAVAIFNLTVPEAQASRQFNGFTLTTPSQMLVKWANYNPTSDSPAMKDQNFVTSLPMNLGNITCNAEKRLILYYMMIPVAWSGKSIKVTLTDTEGDSYEGTISPSVNQEAGKAYRYSASLTYKPKFTDLSVNGTANSYIVSAKGDYKFKATVKGNSTTSVGTVSSAGIVWETQNTTTAPGAGSIVSNISYKDGYIYFSTPATFKKGNALIAAKDASGNILWSWHIWCTDVPADQQYKNNAGYLMDRNLGALATTGDYSSGLLYQWGRKDPFLGSASISSSSQMKATGTAQAKVARSSTNGNIAWTLKNPTTFIYYATASGNDALNWLTSPNANLWKNTSGDVKTMYDPCPPGYRVADGSTTANTEAGRGFYGKALGYNHQVVGTANLKNKGIVWDNTNHYMTITLASGTAYYPGTGCMNDSNGNFSFVGSNAMIWTNVGAGAGSTKEWNTQYSGTFDANFSDSNNYQVTVNWNSGRAAGKSVRCQRESTTKVSSTKANESFTSLTDDAW